MTVEIVPPDLSSYPEVVQDLAEASASIMHRVITKAQLDARKLYGDLFRLEAFRQMIAGATPEDAESIAVDKLEATWKLIEFRKDHVIKQAKVAHETRVWNLVDWAKRRVAGIAA